MVLIASSSKIDVWSQPSAVTSRHRSDTLVARKDSQGKTARTSMKYEVARCTVSAERAGGQGLSGAAKTFIQETGVHFLL